MMPKSYTKGGSHTVSPIVVAKGRYSSFALEKNNILFLRTPSDKITSYICTVLINMQFHAFYIIFSQNIINHACYHDLK